MTGLFRFIDTARYHCFYGKKIFINCLSCNVFKNMDHHLWCRECLRTIKGEIPFNKKIYCCNKTQKPICDKDARYVP